MNKNFKNIKNFVELKGDVALIHINRAGFEHIAIVDREDLTLIDLSVKNRLNIDTNGYVQHKEMINGTYKVFQLHRKIAGAFDWEEIGFYNGNKLDLRKKNLFYKFDGKIRSVL
ncbi:hypothetical protein ABES03_08385 [Neobacillus rhizosphaerae]|uniref:hypothetical protein n=1 Tax=Neobacillus rhizosphaerae TaxID=2880965 RepID=UPI003D29B55B